MRILLTNTIEIEVDSHNYAPREYREVKSRNGTSQYKWVSMEKYFPTLVSCIDWLIHNKLKEGEVRFFVDYLNDYKKLYEQMTKDLEVVK